MMNYLTKLWDVDVTYLNPYSVTHCYPVGKVDDDAFTLVRWLV